MVTDIRGEGRACVVNKVPNCGASGKNLPANAGDAGSIPGQEDPLEKGMANHSSILAWEKPWTEESGGLKSMELQAVWYDLVTK